MIPAAITAAIATIIGVGVFLLLGPGRSPSASVSAVPPVSPPGTVTPETAPPETAGPSTEADAATTEPAVPVVEYSCWDGEVVADLGDCRGPRTDAEAYAYLAYVYPRVAEVKADCEKKKTAAVYSDVAAFLNCPGEGVSTVRYRYWRNLDDAEDHYAKDARKYDAAKAHDVYVGDQSVGGWVRSYNIPEDGVLTLTMFVPELHLSLSIEGKSTSALWDEFERTRIRPVDEILGHRAGQEPSVALLGRG